MKIFLSILLFLPLYASAQGDTVQLIRPKFLQRGDTVALVAPSRKLAQKADTAKVRLRLESWGLHVKYGAHAMDTSNHYFSAGDVERSADIQWALDDSSVRAVIAYQGGYGSVRTLPYLRLEALRDDPKWVVGFSDITMLHLALRRIGVESIHGTMPGSFTFEEGKEDVSAESLRCALFGEQDTIRVAAHPFNRHGTACGRLAGGNLTLVSAAIATPEEIDPHIPTVLLIEDIGESAYRIDRMMQQLWRSGLLHTIRAILVGHFTDISRLKDFDLTDIYHLIAQYTSQLDIPVVYGFPSGHESPNKALYMGREVEVTVNEDGAMVTFL